MGEIRFVGTGKTRGYPYLDLSMARRFTILSLFININNSHYGYP